MALNSSNLCFFSFLEPARILWFRHFSIFGTRELESIQFLISSALGFLTGCWPAISLQKRIWRLQSSSILCNSRDVLSRLLRIVQVFVFNFNERRILANPQSSYWYECLNNFPFLFSFPFSDEFLKTK